MKKRSRLVITLCISAAYIFGMEECPSQQPGSSTVTLLSAEEQEFEVSIDLAKQSNLIKEMLQDIGENNEAIPLPLVSGKTLSTIVNALQEPDQDNVNQILKNLSIKDLLAFINAVNYLDISNLLEASILQLAKRNLSQNDIDALFESLTPNTIQDLWEVHPAHEWARMNILIKELWGNKATFSPDGKYLASTGRETIKIWDINNNFEQIGNDLQHSYIHQVIFDPNGNYLVSIGGEIKIWDINNNFKQVENDLPHDRIITAAFSPDGNYLVSAGGDPIPGGEGIIKIWNVNNNFELIENILQHSQVSNITFSPDGNYLVSTGGGTAKIWDVNNNFQLIENNLQHTQVIKVTFSPDGNYLISTGEGAIKIWDVNNNFQLIENDLQHDKVSRVVFSPDGKYLASNGSNIIKIWDVNNNFKLVKDGLRHAPAEIIFSPDGKYLISKSLNTRIRGPRIKIWDVNNNFKLVKDGLDHNQLRTITFSPNGKYLVSGGREGAIKIWNVDLLQPIILTSEQIKLFLLAYFNVEKQKPIQITNELRTIFNKLTPDLQPLLPEQFKEKLKTN